MSEERRITAESGRRLEVGGLRVGSPSITPVNWRNVFAEAVLVFRARMARFVQAPVRYLTGTADLQQSSVGATVRQRPAAST